MPLIKKLEAAKTKEQLFAVQMEMAPYGESEFFSAYIGADQKNAVENILKVSQSGLTLGQKEYYLENDEATAKIREAYKKHIVRMFQLFGFKKGVAEKKMKNILKVETALAKVSKSNTELRDPQSNYNKMTLQEFDAKYPHFQLERQMNAKGVKSEYIQQLVVGQTEFMAAADKLFAAMKPAEYRDVMEWGIIDGSTGYLNDAVRAANFDFYGKVFSGRNKARQNRRFLREKILPCHFQGTNEDTRREPSHCPR